jgi:hypothetical protein
MATNRSPGNSVAGGYRSVLWRECEASRVYGKITKNSSGEDEQDEDDKWRC